MLRWILDYPYDEARQLVSEVSVFRSDDWVSALVDLVVAERGDLSLAALKALDDLALGSDFLRSSGRRQELADLVSSQPVKIIRALHQHPESLGFAIACSFLSDGYVRESAVTNLIALDGEKTLPYLVFRSGDWVYPVAKAAGKAAERLMPLVSDRALHEAFLAVWTLRNKNFWSSGGVRDAFRTELLIRPGLLESLRKSTFTQGALWLLNQEFSGKKLLGPGERWIDVLRDMLLHRDPAGVAAALRFIDELDEVTQQSLLPELASCPVRVVKLKALAMADRLGRMEILEAGLKDKKWRVRNDARFYLEKRGRGGFIEFYRELLPNPYAVADFGYLAPQADLVELLPYLEHPSALVRVEAIRVLGNRGYTKAADLIRGQVRSESSKVVRAAIAAMRQIATAFSVEELFPLMDDLSRSPQARKSIQSTIVLLSRWDQLLVVLRLTCSGALVHLPTPMLQKWLARSVRDVVGPSLAQYQAIVGQLKDSHSFLQPETFDALEKEVLHWGRLKGF